MKRSSKRQNEYYWGNPHIRTYNHTKYFRQQGKPKSKSAAKATAARWRNGGWGARVIKCKGGYYVYTTRKSVFRKTRR